MPPIQAIASAAVLLSALLLRVSEAVSALHGENELWTSEAMDFQHRSLQDRRAGLRDDDWIPLGCNDDIETANCTEHKFSDLDFYASPVTIPCGECYTVDIGGDLQLEGGLEIVGKLYIPSDAPKVKISAPFIYVQGVLQVEKNDIVTGDSLSVEFYITAPLGDGEQDRVIVPYDDDNKGACPDTGCVVGKVPFVVAGGNVDIKALPPNCPAWVNLQDIVGDAAPIPTEYPVATPAPPSCNRYVISEDFSSGLKNGWRGHLGGKFEVVDDGTGSNYVLKVSNRKRTWQGPWFDLVKHRSCFLSDTEYLVLATVRLSKEDGSDPLCVASKESCPLITMVTHKEDDRAHWRRIATQRFRPLEGLDGWFTMEWKFTLTEEEVSPNAVYQIVFIEGPEAGVDIELDSFHIMLPPESAYPDPETIASTCRNLFPYPSGTDFSYPLYPLVSLANNVDMPQVMEEVLPDNTTNSFLRMGSRLHPWYSLGFLALPSCMQEGASYEVKGNFRLHSPDVINTVYVNVEVQFAEDDGTFTYKTRWEYCPPMGGNLGWVECSMGLTVTPEIEHAVRYRVFVVTGSDSNSNLDFDNLSMLLQASPATAMELPKEVENCWGVGSEILMTPATWSESDYQLFNITYLEPSVSDPEKYIVVGVNKVITPSTTVKEDPDSAVEVALLSRNVKIHGDEFDEGDKGYHFMIMNTPKVVQHIEGVVFVNGGQQGTLGRYPSHFHLCADIDGSIFARNVVRESNQRCSVIHGTHNVTVIDNVAFDTKGHCYMLEEGGEMDNKFYHNLGAMNQKVEKTISFEETDNRPSIFWISQPMNTFVGNVAAGSSFAGFWFELIHRVRGSSLNYPELLKLNPIRDPLQLFRDNVAHSCSTGFRSYPNGYSPWEEEVFVGSRMYRNRGNGFFFHNSRNLAVLGGFAADNNGPGIDIDRLDNARLTNVTIKGYTPQFRTLNRARHQFHRCKSPGRDLIGVEMHYHTTNKRELYPGGRFENLNFTDFDGSGCDNNYAFQLDDERRWNHWDYFTLMSDISMESSMEIMDFCPAIDFLNVHDLVIFDSDESANPKGKTGAGQSVIVSPNDQMTTFIKDSCTFYNEKCYAYCEGVCVRTISFRTQAYGTEGVKMVVVNADTSENITIDSTYDFNWVRVGDTFESRMETRTRDTNLRIFAATLPGGNYSAKLINPDGSEFLPPFISKIAEPAPPCSGYVEEEQLNLELAAPPAGVCDNQINNGDAEMGNYTYWYQNFGGVTYEANAGVNNSYAIRSEERSNQWRRIIHYLDTRCLREGFAFELKAEFRLKNALGEFYDCDPDSASRDDENHCLEATMHGVKKDETSTYYFVKSLVRVGTVVAPVQPGVYNKLYGVFKMKPSYFEYEMFQLAFAGTAARFIYLDNVEFTPLNVNCDGNMIENGSFDSHTRNWRGRWVSSLSETVGMGGTGFAALSSNRVNRWDGPGQDLFGHCFKAGTSYEVLARFRMFDSDDNVVHCNRYYQEGSPGARCPEVGLYVNNVTNYFWPRVASTVDEGAADKWGVLHGIFKTADYMVNANTIELYVFGPQEQYNFAIDEVSLALYSDDCSNLIRYGEFSHEDSRSWQPWGRTEISTITGDSGPSLLVTHRDNYWWGVTQEIPKSCLAIGDLFDVTARVKLVDANDPTVTVPCVSTAVGGDLQCPYVSLRSETSPRNLHRTVAAAAGDAVDGWVTIKGLFEVFASDFQGNRMWVYVSGSRAGVDILVDEVSVTRRVTS